LGKVYRYETNRAWFGGVCVCVCVCVCIICVHLQLRKCMYLHIIMLQIGHCLNRILFLFKEKSNEFHFLCLKIYGHVLIGKVKCITKIFIQGQRNKSNCLKHLVPYCDYHQILHSKFKFWVNVIFLLSASYLNSFS
jgi:hypothetical protein